MTYKQGHIRHDTVTGSVAVRTMFNDEKFPHLAWLISTTGSGAKNATHADVEGEDWVDLYIPPEL